MRCNVASNCIPESNYEEDDEFLKINTDWLVFSKNHYDSLICDLKTVDRWLAYAINYKTFKMISKERDFVRDFENMFSAQYEEGFSFENLKKTHKCKKCTDFQTGSRQIDRNRSAPTDETRNKHYSNVVYETIRTIFKEYRNQLVSFFLELSSRPEYTVTVNFPPFRNEDGSFHPPHQTTLKNSLVAIMARVDTLSAILKKRTKVFRRTIKYAVRNNVLECSKFEKNPLAFSSNLASVAKALEKWKEPKLELGMDFSSIGQITKNKNKWKENIKIAGTQELVKAIYGGAVCFTHFEEILCSFVKRINTTWFTKTDKRYARIILSYLGGFYCKKLDGATLDEFFFRSSKVADFKIGERLYVPNTHMAVYAYETQLELNTRIDWYAKYEKIKFTFDLDDEEEAWKNRYYLELRWFLIIWFRHKMLTANMLTQEFFGDRYHEGFVTELELNWYRYHSKNIAKTNNLTTVTKTKVIEKIRPEDFKAVKQLSSDAPGVMFEKIQRDPKMRGKADWMRFQMTGSVFAQLITKFTAENSKYVLHQGSVETNAHWFEEINFPFIFYNCGRYNLYCNEVIFYLNDLPKEIEQNAKKIACDRNHRLFATNEARRLSDANGKKKKYPILDGILDECVAAMKQNAYLDIHAYLEPDVNSIRLKLADCLTTLPTTKENAALQTELDALYDLKKKKKIKSNPVDDGDNVYDTLSLWVLICLENATHRRKLSVNILNAITSSCEMIIKKNQCKSEHLDPYTNKEIKRLEEFLALTEEYKCKIL